MFRKRKLQNRKRCAYSLAVWAAVVVQLHLFFVTQLHHHTLTLLRQEKREAMRQTHADLVSLPDPPQPCPACQIARQGSVNPTSNIHIAAPVYTEQRLEPTPFSCVFQVALQLHSGRDPPHFSWCLHHAPIPENCKSL